MYSYGPPEDFWELKFVYVNDAMIKTLGLPLSLLYCSGMSVCETYVTLAFILYKVNILICFILCFMSKNLLNK